MSDTEYSKKLETLQHYIPFLDNMILQLKDPSKKNREQQLTKIQSLHAMITDKKKKWKLETLVKCEDVISKLYEKVHNRPITSLRRNVDSPTLTPASPSPPRDVLVSKPLTIPTERLESDRPKIDIYTSAAESLRNQRFKDTPIIGKLPDMSRPPISLEDLKTLEDDVQDKINESSLMSSSLLDLNNLKQKLTEQIHLEEVKLKSPQKKDAPVNTTARNSLSLTKMAIQPPDKPKIKEWEPAAKSSSPTKNKPEDVSETISLKKDVKSSASAESCKQKPQKILKESASIFGSVLSHIDDRLLEGKKKKEERRHSHPGKDERRASDGGKGSSKSPDAKLRSERKFSFSNEDLSVKCSGSKPSSDPRKKESHKKSDKKDKHKSKSEKNNGSDNKSKSSSKESKSKLFSLSGTKSYDEKKEILKHKLQESPKLVDADKETKDSDKEPTAIPNRIAVKKDDELFIPNNNKVVENKEDSANRAQALFKRLADKYNPKPKKTTIDADVDKSVADSIEQNMKTAQPKLPAITPIPEPTPPPASLVKCTRIEQYPTQPAPLSTVLQNIMSPSTTHLINSVVNQLKQTNAEAERLGLLPTPSPLPSNQPLLMRNSPTVAPTNALLSPPTREDNWVSEYCRESNFAADFVRDNFNDDYGSNMPPNDFGNAQFNPPMRQDRLRFEAPAQQQGNFAESPRYVPPMNDRFGGDNFNQNAPFQQDRFRQGYSYGSKKQVDMQSLDYYPPNAPVPANVNMYNCGPPLLSPEMPNFQNEQKPNTFGIGHDPFSQNEPVWRTEDNLPYWQQDQRMSRDPRTYREYREMREARDRECRDPRLARDSRDPRDNRDSRDNRDPRENRDPRVNRDPRDPRLKVRDPRDKDYERDRSRDVQPNKFDRIYSRTNRKRDRSRSRSRTDWSSSQSKESFVSPLDSLYTGKEDHRTGKGYGVQSFRIPKIKKEDDHKEKEEQKVTSTNEDLTEPNACEPVEMELESDNEEGSKAEEKHTADANKAVEGSPREKDMEKPQEVESSKEVESEAPKVTSSQTTEPETKPADQTILAQFFANLLGSNNKRDKKTALYSLISTFSDSFSDKELSKITKIIKANEDEEDESSEEEDDAKKEALKQGEEKEVEIKDTSNEAEKVDSEIITPRAGVKRRARRISSSSPSKEEPFKESECPKTPEPMEIEGRKDSGVIVTVGERIKSRKRIPATLSKPKKRCRTELDMLHEDIQDMFIRDGVLTASGKRMCRLLKDDPNVLAAAHPPETNTLPVEVPKVRKKPGPKPKPRPPNASEVKVMKSVRVVIPKMPESNVPQIEETPKRTLRSSARNVTYADSDDESDLLEDAAIAEDKSLADEDSSVREDDSDESSEDEKDETAHPDETRKSKVVKRKRGKIWASGIIHNKKKKKKQSSFDESDVTSNKDIVERGVGSATGESDGDKSYVEPDKGYYVDSLSNKSKECKICNYRGRFITTHYKTNHPESEILSSRLSPAAAEEAVRDAEQNLAKYESIMRVKGGYKFKYVCRFCEFSTHVPPTIFYDHVTTHTGEYRHICPMCSFSASSGKTLKVHLSSCHQNIEKRVARKSYGQTVVFGYLCGECNYVQLTRKNVEDHINVFHLQKPTIYKITLSKVLDEEIEKVADEMGAVEASVYDKVDREPPEEKVSEPDIQVEKQMPPPQRKKRGPKPGPRSAKKKMQERAQRRTEATTDSDSVTTDTESVSSKESTNTSTERDFEKVAPVVRKRISREVSMEEEPIVGRSRRAAKDKAAEKLKNLMEFTEGPPRKRCQPTEKNRVESEEDSVKEAPQELPKEPPKEIVKEETVEPVKDKKEGEVNKKEEDKQEVKKEIEPNVFTCNTDIVEENKKIEKERLKMMDELNKSVGSRTSLNFVDKLCDRLNQSNVVVKEEPRDFFPGDNFSRNHVNKSPLAMPVLEKEKVAAPVTSAAPPPPPAVTVTSKKPILETEVTPIAQSSFDVVQKNDKVINDMIQKLKGKLMTPSDDKLDSPITLDDTDYDSEGPPPLTHVNELVNIKPADATTKTLLIGGLVKVIKSSGSLVFSCLVPPCVYSTEDQDAFQVHCREAHRQSSCNRPSTLCETCGMEVVSNTEGLLLESLFTHAITEHGDFIHKDSEVVEAPIRPIPPTRTIRLRKLSGDALSIIKKDDDVEQNENIAENREDHKVAVASEEASVETTPTPMADEPVTMAELEMTEDNPFPFKIAGVMSLAEPQPPPLAPLAKSSLQIAPGAQLIVKEARMSKYELKKPRKTQKAMAKFIESVSDLYKCPHYYCLFSTNFRDFLERHLKAHKVDQDVMVPCVYCDMKTPWEHVPMHIDIRHAHCRYACSYCLYRAILKEYVALHQDQSHPDKNYSVIALPQPKSSKKFAIAENKADPKALCLPFKCTKVCNVEFLFESEFRRHLNDNHGKNYIHCGHEGCTVRINANLMPKHWVTHDVSSYQCGYCKFNKPVLKDLYCHLAKSHPGCNPEILIRSNPSHTGQPLGYTPDAFKMMVKVTNIPKSLDKLVTRPLSAVGGPKLDKLQTPNTSLLKPPLKTYSLLTSGAGTSSGGNYLILTSSSAVNALSNIVLTPTSPLIDSTALVNTVSSVSTAAPSVQECSTIASVDTVVSASPQEEIALIQADQTKGAEETSVRRSEPTDNSQENQLSIDPVMEPEHIDVGDDHHSSGEDADPTDVDPLSLDTDLGEASKAAEGLSSDEECDESKVEKSKKAKIGLLSYQLYRCAFCEESFSNSNDFKRHVHKSLLCRKEDNPAKPFMCVHCRKKMKSAHVLAEHIQCHGILRFSCSLCSNKYPTPGQARSHAKARHNITQTTLTPLRPHKTNIDIDEYVVRPRLVLQPPPPTEAVSSEPATSAAPQDNVYMPDETDKLPMRHILSASVKCGLCSYMTKVRTNMVRHLQFHSQEKAVSESAPVNPVPCLEKNEKMFDKMVNLASSSHSTSRMSGAKGDGKEKEAENLPEFVLSHCRYVCPAQGCNYLCPEEANLRHHILALHDNETSFTCCHCKLVLTQTDADSLLKHLKLHGLQLHKCQYCSFMHNLKHKVEKHVADNHLDLPVKVITVRCLESEPNDEEPSTSAPSTVQLKVHKPWRCCMCKYKSGTQEAIQQHVLEKHEVDAQFKCTLCTFKNNDKDSLAAHFKDAHNNQTIDMIYTYRKMEEDKEKESETFDTTPLWQRDRPRVRHIRGILFEESSPVVSKSPKKVTKNAPTPGPAASKTATPAPGPSVPRNVNLDSSIESVVNGTADILKGALSKAISDADLDDAGSKPAEDSNEQTEQQNADDDMDVIVIEDDEDKDGVASSGKNKEAMKTPKSRPTKRKAAEAAAITKLPKMSEEVIDLESPNSDSDQDEFSERNLRLRYGGYGLPLSKQLKCPACNQFKSKRIADFIFHLYKEMKVYRFKCKICADESITFRYMYRHVLEHKVTDFDEHITFLPPDPRLEAWIQIVIREQSLVILQNFSPAPDSNVNGSVPCNFCGRMYRSEQEKNEHTIIHWSIKPFGCAMCKFTCYNAQEVEKHLEQTHKIDNAASQFVCAKAPTVVKELKLSDDSHLKEANSKFYKEAPEAETVPEEDPLMLPDDVSADPPVKAAAADVTATSSDRFSELVSDQKEEDDELRDLVIVTKTDSNVPKESDVFCCEYCPFMTNSETYVISHITSVHEHMHIKFKTLNKLACETSIKDYVACTVCNEAGSEIRIRQHYMEEHEGQTFLMYRFICSVCGRKFLKMNGLKSHCKKMHPGSQLEYVGLNVTRREDGEQGTATPLPTSPVLVTVPAAKLEAKHLLRYKCSMCRYERDFPPNQVTNVRSHVRQHFKAYFCGVCVNSSFRTRQAAANHFAKAHAGMPENVVHNAEVIEMYNVTMAKIIIDARPATEADAKSAPVSGTRKPVARKSTAAPFKAAHGFAGAGPPKEYSYYGQAPEPVDLGKIKTVVELNGMCLNMTAEKLSKIFDLEARVVIEDCNLSVNLSTLFDS